MARERLLLPLLATALTVTGCLVPEQGKVIDWDLSHSHTSADVDWPNPDVDAVEVQPVKSVRLRLPEGHRLQSDDVSSVDLERRGDLVTTVQVNSEKKSTDDAYRLAVRLAKEWGLRRDKLDDWYRERHAGRERGNEDLTSTATATTPPGRRVGEGGPEPSLKILYSFDEDKPSIVSLRFFW